MIIVTSLYVGFGVCGYLSFGPDTEDIITLNLPGGLFPFLVKGFLCFSLYFTYPIMMFPVTTVLERMFFSQGTADTNYLLGCVLRSVLVLVSGLIVVAIPNFSILMALVGSGCCTMLGFILPAVFHWLIFRGDLSLGARLFNMFLIILGITGSIIGTVDAISRLYGDKTTAQVQPSISPPLSLHNYHRRFQPLLLFINHCVVKIIFQLPPQIFFRVYIISLYKEIFKNQLILMLRSEKEFVIVFLVQRGPFFHGDVNSLEIIVSVVKEKTSYSPSQYCTLFRCCQLLHTHPRASHDFLLAWFEVKG
ncbi:Amino acid transporter AVT3B [Geodia barretti]|nr:Amino acid transporter AVT3B [Geodia barretti]